jgi:hypothetical protein
MARETLPDQSPMRSPDLLGSVRALAGPCFVVAGWSLMSVSFVGGACVAYAGFAICFAECIWEPELVKRPYQYQVIGIGVIVFFLTLFSINVVFVHAPICLTALEMGPVYNLSPAGIVWKPFYTELDLIIANQTDTSYQSLDVLVRPNSPVAGIGQQGNIGNVSFQDRYGAVGQVAVTDTSTGEVTKEPLMATDAGYIVHCPELPPHTGLRLVLAIGAIVPSPPPTSSIQQGGSIPGSPVKDSIHASVKIPDAKEGDFYYWYGNKDNAALWVANTEPTKVTVRGSYVGGHRSRYVDENIPVKKLSQ